MTALPPVLGIDFGTSNSAAGITEGGRPRLIEIDAGEQTMPTAVFFDFDRQTTVFGHPANRALIDGDYGRYMRGLKSLLGTALMREKRRLLKERLDFIEITGRFLAHLKTRAEAVCGRPFLDAVSGRPVVFHDGDPIRNAQAETDLRDCYAAAGFRSVRFLNEPEAAAQAYGNVLADGTVGMVVDIGGGTSDFTLFRAGGATGIDLLGSHGIRMGGTDFDRTLSIHHVMPLLGRGTEIRHAFGSATHLAPNAIFNDLATWAKIPFLYTPEIRRAAADLARNAVQPEALSRLVRVLEEEIGHDLAFAVEAGKIAANAPGAEHTVIDLRALGADLRRPLTLGDMAVTLADHANAIAEGALTAVRQAGMEPGDVDGLVLVGGTSLMHVVSDALQHRFPGTPLHRAAALTAVADGLALAAGQD